MRRFVTPVLLLVAFVLLSCRTFAGITSQSPGVTPVSIALIPNAPASTVGAPVSAPDLVSLQDSLVKVYELANPGVVALRVPSDQGGSRGSGFVFDRQGHILTNNHVLEGQGELEVAFASGFKVRGSIIGQDLDSDIAVIQVDAPAEELHPLAFADSDQVRVGQAVIAIGNPFGFNGTMTLGIVSGLGRTMESDHNAPGGGNFSAGDIIQTDAAINPGNSGGPLLNLDGEVIGINRAIYTTSFSSVGQPVNSGIGFAVSSNIVQQVVPELIKYGKYDYPFVGITTVDDLSLAEIEALGLSQSTGIYVTGVSSGSPAADAGLRAGVKDTSLEYLKAGGDLIIGIDERQVRNYGDFIGYLIRYKHPGDPILLTILRSGRQIQVEVTVVKRPGP
jgi:2-alkenal reductase